MADGCVSATPPAGRQQMHPDHEDAALGHAVDRLPQPEVQNWQSDRCEGWNVKFLESQTEAAAVFLFF